MEARRWFAATGALALHALAIVAALGAAAPQAVREIVRPVEVALITPPRPEPPPPPKLEPPRPLPPRPAPPPARPKPAAPKPALQPVAPAPEPPRPVAAAAPLEQPRPAAIAVEAAPPGAPVAPRVAEGVPPAPPARAPAPAPAAPAPVRTAPRADASWAGNAPPSYPAMARRLGEEGEVRLDVHVGANGGVLEVRLKKSSGSQLLDRTAIETVKKWRFAPATVDGKPVAEWYYDWKWVFKLES